MQGEGELVGRLYIDGVTCAGGFAIAGVDHLRLDVMDVYGDDPDEVYRNTAVLATEDDLRALRDAIDAYLDQESA